VAKSSPATAQNNADWPRLLESKDIAEEGFIHRLPIMMNYATMYEFAVDRNSGQFKTPFNQINHLSHVATYNDTAVTTPNSDTPYSKGLGRRPVSLLLNYHFRPADARCRRTKLGRERQATG